MATSKGELIFSTDGGYGQLMNYVRDGKVVTRKRHNLTSKSATPKQLEQQPLLGNVVHGYKAMDQGGDLHPSFPERKRGSTDYNRFVSINRRDSDVFLTREQVEAGYCVLDNWVISQGSLTPPVRMAEETGFIVSDICVGTLEVTPSTSVVELSMAIIANNGERFRNGDLLAYFYSVQKETPSPRILYVGTTAGKVNLSTDVRSTQKLGDITEAAGFSSVLKNGLRYLAIPAVADSMGTYVQTRIGYDGQMLVTTETMVGTNSKKQEFTTAQAKIDAMESYAHHVKREFLRPSKKVNTIIADYVMGSTGGQGGNSGNPDPTQVELTFAVNNSAWGTVTPESGLYTVGSTIQAVATPKSGCEFTGWSDGVTTATRTITVPATAQTYTANFRSGGGLGVWLEQHPDATPEEIAEEMKRLKEAGEL